jgi:prophage antirepressor-like protein
MKIAQFQQINFECSNIYATIHTSGNPWFLAGDARKVLAIPNSRQGLTQLGQETRTALPKDEVAIHLNRAQKTLRLWAMRNHCPIKRLRINSRLARPTYVIYKLPGD